MIVEWTAHRFVGGVLALDVANTVVLRIDPHRSFDRFESPIEIARFAAAASEACKDELSGAILTVRQTVALKPTVVCLREATDHLFRDAVEHGSMHSQKLSALLRACADALPDSDRYVPERSEHGRAVRFETAVAMSAISLLQPERISRLRVCRNCGWLFIDRSRNASRIWCDMAVCGNRHKAARHYKKHREFKARDVEAN